MMTSIANSLGAGSGIDIAGLVRDLAAASRAPKVEQFDARQRASQAKISAVAQARADLESFATSFGQVVSQGTLQTQPSVSDETALSAVAAAGVRLGNFASDVEVIRLARAQSVYSAPLASASDPVGQGALTLSVGGQDHAIVIDSTNDNLTGLAAAINAAASGVRASIVTDTAGARLVLKGETGTAKAFALSAQAGSDSALDRFAYGGSGGMTLAQAAQDAQFTLDGIPYTRATNIVSDAIPGVTITLKKAAPGAVVAIGVKRPGDAIKSTMTDFVNVFNQLKQDIAAARTATGGDQALRALDQQLSRFLSQAVTSSLAFKSLSDIGVATNRDGTISLDAAKLDTALAADPDAVEALFSPTRDASHTISTDPGLFEALKTLKTSATSPGGTLESLKERLSKEAAALARDRVKMEERETRYAASLEKRFGGIDARLGALKATQSYLDQQVKLWTRSS